MSTELGRSVGDSASVGERIRLAREASGMTRSDFLQSMSISQEALESWEGNQSEPRSNHLQRISALLDVSIRWLLTGTGVGPDGDQVDQLSPEVSNILKELRTERAELQEISLKLGILEKRLRVSIKKASRSGAALGLDDLHAEPENAEIDAEEVVLRSELNATCSYIDEVGEEVRHYLEKVATQVTLEHQTKFVPRSTIGKEV